MTRLPQLRRRLSIALMLFVVCTSQVCSAADKDPFTLTAKNAGKVRGRLTSAILTRV